MYNDEGTIDHLKTKTKVVIIILITVQNYVMNFRIWIIEKKFCRQYRINIIFIDFSAKT